MPHFLLACLIAMLILVFMGEGEKVKQYNVQVTECVQRGGTALQAAHGLGCYKIEEVKP